MVQVLVLAFQLPVKPPQPFKPYNDVEAMVIGTYMIDNIATVNMNFNTAKLVKRLSIKSNNFIVLNDSITYSN